MVWREHWGLILTAILVLPVLSVIAFALWMRRNPKADLETGAKAWDIFIRLISALTLTITGAMVFGKYIEERAAADAALAGQANRELRLREAEFLRQKLLFETQRHERKVKLLGEAKTVAARIASSATPDRASVTRFNELYQADLIGVEKLKGEVEQAMVRFRRKLRQENPIPDGSLEDLSLELSAAVETELKESEEALLEQHRAIARLLAQPD